MDDDKFYGMGCWPTVLGGMFFTLLAGLIVWLTRLPWAHWWHWLTTW